jgi:uncharacterized RDD family membrane protein YckC
MTTITMPVGTWTPSAAVNETGSTFAVWDIYQVSLSAEPARAPKVPVALPGRRPLADWWVRLTAAAIDGFLLALTWAAIQYVGFAFADSPALKQPLANSGFAIALAYCVIQGTLLARRGQTVGKMVTGIRIVRNADDTNPGFWSSCVLRVVVPALFFALPVIGPLLALIDGLSILGSERRCLHDLIANTKVVEA